MKALLLRLYKGAVAVELGVGESVSCTGHGGPGGETARPLNKKKNKKKVDGIFVINGFYMSMRNTYTTPPAKIHYYTVQWPTDALAWKSFRVCFFFLCSCRSAPLRAAPGPYESLYSAFISPSCRLNSASTAPYQRLNSALTAPYIQEDVLGATDPKAAAPGKLKIIVQKL
jgi:hypothetical protein